jgi:CubicO group peptidase (beta-lactamase class C family)
MVARFIAKTVLIAAICWATFASCWAEDLFDGLILEGPRAPTQQPVSLGEAMRLLHIPSASLTLILGDRVVQREVSWQGADTSTIYQAASLSKLVTAVAALRLVEQGRLDLDRDVNEDLVSWKVPVSELTRGHPVTLRGLLSMTGGIGVPGYLGYAPGTPLPDLAQTLDGLPPANSAPVRVEYVPGTRYAYSGGGYEIMQALIADRTGQPFERAMESLVLQPAEMTHSFFAAPLPAALESNAARGHDADGTVLPGGWRVIPELAAGGLWSTSIDLAKLLSVICRAYRLEPNPLLRPPTAREMLTPQNGAPYGLGAAVARWNSNLVVMKRGQNVGYQSYMLIFPNFGQGIVVMTGSDNGSTLAAALIRRAAQLFNWPAVGELED